MAIRDADQNRFDSCSPGCKLFSKLRSQDGSLTGQHGEKFSSLWTMAREWDIRKCLKTS